MLTNSRHKSAVIYLLLLVFLSLRVGGAVAHYCFDGLEPPVTVHFDNLNGHLDHDHEPGHVDVEKEVLSDNLIGKLIDFDSLLGFVALFIFALSALSRGPLKLSSVRSHYTNPQYYLPPSRAPPSYS